MKAKHIYVNKYNTINFDRKVYSYAIPIVDGVHYELYERLDKEITEVLKDLGLVKFMVNHQSIPVEEVGEDKEITERLVMCKIMHFYKPNISDKMLRIVNKTKEIIKGVK